MEDRAGRRRRPPGRRRESAATYRRRRLAALGAALALGIGIVGIGGAGHDDVTRLSAEQALRIERTADPVRFTVSVSGDLLIHSPLWDRALVLGNGDYDFAPMLAELRPHVARADLALCHVETPMTPRPPSSYPIFNTPPELARAIAKTGWDACDTASNHSLDQGQYGIDATAEALDRAGVPHTGSFRSPAERRRPLLLDAAGVTLGFIAYSDSTNGIPLPQPWSENVAPVEEDAALKAKRILADARRAARAGAEGVILNMHWGDEYATEPNAAQLELARRLVASPLITAIVGQGPHVPGPIRRLKGKFVVFSEGNLISNQSPLAGLPAETQYGLIALLHCVADGRGVRVERISYVPTYVRLTDYTVLPVGSALREQAEDPAALDAAYDTVVELAGRGPRITPVPAALGG